MPLDEASVERALKPPDEETLRVQASELVHPILEPLAFDDRDGLSPDEAAVLAVLINPMLRSVRDERGLADAQLLQAGILPNPQFSFGLDVPTGANTAGEVNAWGIDLGWDVTALISHDAAVESAAAHLRQVELDVAWQEWQVAEAARSAVFQLVALRQQAQLAAEMDDLLAQNLAVIRRATDEGQMTGLDLSAAEAASNQAHASLLEFRQQTEAQWLQLDRALGVPEDRRPDLEAGIELPGHVEVPVMADLSAGLEERRLDLVALRRGYDSQEASVRQAILEQFPRISLGVNRIGDTGDFYTLGFGVGIDLPVFDRNQGRIAIERATRQQLFDEYVNRLFEARSDMALIISRIDALNGRIEAAEAAEPGLERLLETYRAAVDQGQADVLSYYQAWQGLAQQRIDALSLKQQLAEARIDLELAAGLYRLGSSKAGPGDDADRPGEDPGGRLAGRLDGRSEVTP